MVVGTDLRSLPGDELTGREEESKYCLFNFYFFILFLPSGGGLVPFVHPHKYAPDAKTTSNALEAVCLYAEAFPNRRHPLSLTFTRIH